MTSNIIAILLFIINNSNKVKLLKLQKMFSFDVQKLSSKYLQALSIGRSPRLSTSETSTSDAQPCHASVSDYMVTFIKCRAIKIFVAIIGGGETGSMYMQSNEVRWYVYWQPLKSL